MQDFEQDIPDAIRQKYLDLGGARWLARMVEEAKCYP